MRYLSNKATAVGVRTEMLSGREHIVIPVVAAVEGVLNGSLLLMDNVAKTLEAWEGVLVTLAHPSQNGNHISASTQYALENFVVGHFFNAHIDEENHSLDGEFWIAKEALDKHPEDRDLLLEKIENGEIIEVSTGYFADHANQKGVYNGKAYNNVQFNLVPNHIAILLHETGACSVADGCGTPRINAEDQPMERTEEGFWKKWNGKIASAMKSFNLGGLDLNKVGHREIENHLRETIRVSEGGTQELWIWLVEVYDDTVVYAREHANGEMDLLMRSYTIENEKTMEISLGESQEVRQVISFEPVKNDGKSSCKCHNHKEVSEMDRTTIIAQLAENSAVPFNRAQLEAMDDAGLKFLAKNTEVEEEKPTDSAPAATVEPTTTAAAPEGAAPAPAVEAQPATNGLKPEVAKALNDLGADGINRVINAAGEIAKNEKAEKDRLVSTLKANAACQVPVASLEAMDVEGLRGLARSLNINHAGRGGPAAQPSGEKGPPAAPRVVTVAPVAQA